MEFNLLGSISAFSKLHKEVHRTQRGVFELYSWWEIHSEATLTTLSLLPLNEQPPELVSGLVEGKNITK